MTGRAGEPAHVSPARFRKHSFWWLVFAMTALLAEPLVHAQVPPVFDPTGRSGEPPGPLKKEYQRPIPPPRQVLPPAPLPPGEPTEKRLGQIRVFVHDIHVVGSTVFTDAELAEVTAPFRGRILTTEGLERLRLSLTLLYVNKGYLTSGAVIPDQDVTFGVITIKILEGALTRIDVEGNNWFRSSYLRDRLELGVSQPLTLGPLNERLQLLQQDRRIERINAELRPGDQPGESVLNLRVTDKNPFHAYIDGNNYQTPLVGEFRGLGTVVDDNLTGHGDAFSLMFGGSAGAFPILDTSYALPLNRYDTTFSAYYRRNDYLLVEQPFTPLDIKTNTEIIGMSLRHPVYRTVTDEVAVSIIGEHLFMQTFLFNDVGFGIFPGTEPNGVATVSALRFAQDWTHRTLDTVLALRSRFSVGLNVLGATITPNADNPQPGNPDGQFLSWLGQAQGIRQFGEDFFGMQLLGRMDLQLTNTPLFPLEQVSLGGRYSVRGYREVTLLVDNAFLASVESRFPIWRWANGEPMFQLAPFADVGHGWNLGRNQQFFTSTGLPNTIASVGVGLRWSILPKDRANFEVYWGQKLVHVPRVGDSLQDYGIHLGLTITLL